MNPPATRPTGFRYVVLGLVSLGAMIAYLTRNCLSPAASTMQEELGLTGDDGNQQMGKLLAVWAIGYAFFQLPGGWMGNVLGRRLTLPLMCVAWSATAYWTAIAETYNEIWWSRLMFGIAQAGLIPCVARLLLDWFPVQSRGFSGAVFACSMSIGGIAATGLTATLLGPERSWRAIMEMYAMVSIFWAVLFWLSSRDRPEDHPLVNEGEVRKIRGERTETVSPSGEAVAATATPTPVWRQLLAPRLYPLYGQAVCRAASYAFFATWAPKFLEQTMGISKQAAGQLTMLPLATIVIGTFLGGTVIDAVYRRTNNRWLSRCGVASASLILTGLIMAASILAGAVSPEFALGVVCLAGFTSGFSHPANFAVTQDLGGKNTALIMAILNMMGNLGAAAAPIVIGGLLDTYKDPVSTQSNWNPVLLFVGVVYVVGGCLWLLVSMKPRATSA